MNNEQPVTEQLSKILDRRSFLRRAGGSAAALMGASALLGAKNALAENPFRKPSTQELDSDVLQFALNLEYVEAEYYAYAVTGRSITEQSGTRVDGAGERGGVTIKNNPRVPFKSRVLRSYAEEIAADELAHVKFLRDAIKDLGFKPIARPQLDLLNSFNALAKAAGLGNSFDPFANEVNFLLGAFIFEDVGVTAYRGAAPLLSDPDVLSYAAGILAVEAYHAGNIRGTLYGLSATSAGRNIIPTIKAISDVRDSLDILPNRKNGNTDQGIADGDGSANIVPTDSNALAFARTTRQVLNIVYGKINASQGLFFPKGFNGAITK